MIVRFLKAECVNLHINRSATRKEDMEISQSGATNENYLNKLVGLTILLLSVVMSIGKIKDDNIVQAMQAKKYRYLGQAYRIFLIGLTLTLITFVAERFGLPNL